MKNILTISGIFLFAQTFAQSNIDNNAIHRNDSRIKAWATGCTVIRGWQNNVTKDSLASFGNTTNAIGAPTSSNAVLSLGDSGIATLTFANPIKNGSGPDFAVFENGFVDVLNPEMAFLEFAFVEVSSDGQRFVRFPATYLGQDTFQYSNFDYVNGKNYKNLAGRYVWGYGTPFDLEELKDSAGININNITHVRLLDVVGSINPRYGTKDKNGKMINDPNPTDFFSSGFDLAGVAVLHQVGGSSIATPKNNIFNIHPNPAKNYILISTNSTKKITYSLVNVLGQTVATGTVKDAEKIDLQSLSRGFYTLILKDDVNMETKKIILQ